MLTRIGLYRLEVAAVKSLMDRAEALAEILGTLTERAFVAVLGGAKVTVPAGKRLLVENHRGVLSYGDAQIIVRLPRGKLSVSGSALSLLVMTSEQLLIGGRIQTLEWE